jgi:hypothetical protein
MEDIMSNWVDVHLDVLAASPQEINQIERALQEPCDELIAWCAQRSGEDPKEIAAGVKEIVTFDDDDMTTMDYIVAGDEPEPPAAAAKVCPKCGKQYSRYWVRLYDRDIRYRHAGKRDATRDEDCYVPYETETTDTGVSVTPTTQTTNLKL